MNSFDYNVTGQQRKALARAVSEILGEDAVYQGAPTFAYAVDGYTISRNGVLTCPDNADHEEVERLVSALRGLNFVPEGADDTNRLTVEMPRSGFSEETFGNLQKIITSKARLLRKSLETETLVVETTSDTLRFPWFTLHGLDGEADAYTRLIAAICKMAKEQKRVIARERNFNPAGVHRARVQNRPKNSAAKSLRQQRLEIWSATGLGRAAPPPDNSDSGQRGRTLCKITAFPARGWWTSCGNSIRRDAVWS